MLYKEESKGFFPNKDEINRAIHSFSYLQMIFFILFFVIFIGSVFLILDKVNNRFLIERPLIGGYINEGIVGSPRFINPVLAISNTDKDLTSLIYSGLMKKNIFGEIKQDLAESYEISEDGLTYTFKIKDDAVFHDKIKVTADDISFTITQIQDGKLKSPVQANWDSVSVLKIDEQTIQFKLPRINTSFLENTTVGILPLHIWKELDTDDFTFSDRNIYAIGSGPYKIQKIKNKKGGLIENITLKSFSGFYDKKPYISKIKFIFYKNEDEMMKSFQKGSIDQISAISPEKANNIDDSSKIIIQSNLSRIFGIFFNSNKQEIFRNKNILTAINLALDKENIVEKVLMGYGKVINSPIPEHLYNNEEGRAAKIDIAERIESAKNILEKDGWKLGEDGIRVKDGKRLSFSLSTGDALELQRSSEIIKDDLTKIGIDVEVKVFEIGNLNQSIIRPREYEALFFGQVIMNKSDIFAFWHSGQRNDPGLNISSYTNSRVDGFLERLLNTSNRDSELEYLKGIEKEITNDMPAIFVYSPSFIYATNRKIKKLEIGNMSLPSDRFMDIQNWHIRTERVWSFLNK